MKPRPILAAIVLVVLIGLPVMVCARRLGHALSQLLMATSLLEQTAHDAQEIVDLRMRQERIGLAQRPTQDVIAQVNAVLAKIGVPTQRLKNLAPEADSAVEGAQSQGVKYRRQSLRLTLEDLSVTEIGAFLAAWQQSSGGGSSGGGVSGGGASGGGGGVWTPSRIEMLHTRGQSSSNAVADLNRYDLTILISAIYVAENS